jgi:pre-rRNA-processing protein TSR1
MKCHFNDFIKSNDTVCLPLYKRQYPIWFEKTWNSKAVDEFEEKEEEEDNEMEDENEEAAK